MHENEKSWPILRGNRFMNAFLSFFILHSLDDASLSTFPHYRTQIIEEGVTLNSSKLGLEED